MVGKLDNNENNQQMFDFQQLAKVNTSTNAGKSSLQLAVIIKSITPILKFCQYKPRSPAASTIKDMIWKEIKPFEDVGDIKLVSTKIQVMWDEFEINEYTHTIPIAKIMEFINCLVQKKKPWIKMVQAIKLLNKTFVALTKTSPEVFLNNWKRNGDFHLSAPGSLWTTAIKVLGCPFQLKIPVKVTAKGILKNYMKGLK